jgi:hypothetical protein
MATWSSVLFLCVVPLALYVGLFSGLAAVRNLSLGALWAAVVGAVIPWLISTLVVVFSANFLPAKQQQAGVMAGLFPMLGTLGVIVVSSLVSLFLRPELEWKWRLQWFAIVSAVPAALLTAGILAVFVFGDRAKS